MAHRQRGPGASSRVRAVCTWGEGTPLPTKPGMKGSRKVDLRRHLDYLWSPCKLRGLASAGRAPGVGKDAGPLLAALGTGRLHRGPESKLETWGSGSQTRGRGRRHQGWWQTPGWGHKHQGGVTGTGWAGSQLPDGLPGRTTLQLQSGTGSSPPARAQPGSSQSSAPWTQAACAEPPPDQGGLGQTSSSHPPGNRI